MSCTYIYGTNDLAKSLYYHIGLSEGVKPTGFIVSPEYFSDSASSFCGRPVFPFDKIANTDTPSDIGVFICIGYKKMNKGREEVYYKCKKAGFSILNFIHPSAHVDAMNIGEGNIIMHNVVIGEFAAVGNCNIFRSGSLLAHGSSIESFNYLSDHTCIGGNAEIGSRCFFGLNSTVSDGVKIKDEVLIGANAFVSKNIESGKVIVPMRSTILEEKTGTDFL